MRNFYVILFTAAFLFFKSIYAQNPPVLQVGDKAPPIVLPTANKSLQSFTFPYTNKVVYIYFWSSVNTASRENLYRYGRMAKLYADAGYKEPNGFEIITIALQSDKQAWADDVRKYNMGQMHNCLAEKAYEDFYVRTYKVTRVPLGYLVNEKGFIVMVNPSIGDLQGYLEDQRNAPANMEEQTKIAGKILYGDNDLKPLKDSKIYVTNAKNDTLQTVQTNSTGNFVIKNIQTDAGMSLKISKSPEMKSDDRVYLASEKGEVISGFNNVNGNFEYKLLSFDMVYLKPMKEEDVTVKKAEKLNGMYFSENLFKNGGFEISEASKAKLDALIVKMKLDPAIHVDIISHTDSKGNADFNQKLSEKRSKVVAAYFISKGIPANHIKASGKGESEPVNTCIDGVPCTEKELELNRRTEFRFYKIQ